MGNTAGEAMKKHTANIITGCRIICSILLLIFPAFSPWFYALYLLGGFTDMIDGTVARKTNAVSEFGSKLDSAADFVFVSACLIKLFPAVDIPVWMWIWILAVAAVKTVSIIINMIYRKELAAVHTVMNKITGFLLFLLPLTLNYIDIKYSGFVVCAAATAAAVQEQYYVIKGKKVS